MTHVIISELNGSGWILTKPVTEDKANELWHTFTNGLPANEVASIVTVDVAKQKNLIGQEYLNCNTNY